MLSFGSDSKADHLDPLVIEWAGRYARVIVWADDPVKASKIMHAIPGACGLRSPVIEGAKLDANALLQEPGALLRFALAAWQHMEQAPAVIQRENSAPTADQAAVEADLRARIAEAEERIARGQTLLETETDPERVARYRARLAELTAQVNAYYDQISALPVDSAWPN